MPLSQGVDLDSISATVVAGEGVAGTPAGGVVSVQGVAGGIVVPVTGTLGALIFDSAGDTIHSVNQNVLTADIVNVGSQFRAQSVTTTAAQALGAASVLTNRKFIQITPTNGVVYYGTSSSVTTTTGTPLFANQTLTASFGTVVQLWVISAGTVDVRVLECS